jgi:hypothetical protein
MQDIASYHKNAVVKKSSAVVKLGVRPAAAWNSSFERGINSDFRDSLSEELVGITKQLLIF